MFLYHCVKITGRSGFKYSSILYCVSCLKKNSFTVSHSFATAPKSCDSSLVTHPSPRRWLYWTLTTCQSLFQELDVTGGILLFSAKSRGNAVRIFMPSLPLSMLSHQVLGHYQRGNCPKKEARLKIMMFFYTHLLLVIRKWFSERTHVERLKSQHLRLSQFNNKHN